MKDYKEICKSLRKHPEEWEIKFNKERQDDYELVYFVIHKKSGIKTGLFLKPRYYKEWDVVFFNDSSVRLELNWWSKWRIYRAVKVAQTRKLRRQLNPETAYFTNMGEKFLVRDLVE